MQPRILVLENDTATREVLEIVLTLEGWEPLLTSTCAEALDILQTAGHISLIILDFYLTDETCERFSEAIPPHIPILLFTASQDYVNLTTATKAWDCIRKPCDLDYLITTVRLFLLPTSPPYHPPALRT